MLLSLNKHGVQPQEVSVSHKPCDWRHVESPVALSEGGVGVGVGGGGGVAVSARNFVVNLV